MTTSDATNAAKSRCEQSSNSSNTENLLWHQLPWVAAASSATLSGPFSTPWGDLWHTTLFTGCLFLICSFHFFAFVQVNGPRAVFWTRIFVWFLSFFLANAVSERASPALYHRVFICLRNLLGILHLQGLPGVWVYHALFALLKQSPCTFAFAPPHSAYFWEQLGLLFAHITHLNRTVSTNMPFIFPTQKREKIYQADSIFKICNFVIFN